MLWNEFVKLSRISKLPLNEQVRKFNEYTLDEENLHYSTKNVGDTTTFVTITLAPAGGSPNGFGIVELYVNNTLVLTQTDLGSKSTLLNPGNTFFIKFYNTLPYDDIEYRLRNKGVQISYNNSGGGGSPLISPTFTVAANSNYVFTCNGYST
jgi:hypothetical protein